MFDEQLLQAIVTRLIDGIVVIDRQGTILTVNPAMCELFDLGPRRWKDRMCGC